MPDFERRSSASFISSKEGGTPASFSRSLMKRRSSYCLRVSIASIPPVGTVFRSRKTVPTGGMLAMLTRKQYELLRFINERLKEAGVPPSFDEMKDALDLRSKSGIHRLITALEERGFIRRLPNRARAIEVIKLPELSSGNGSSRRGFTPSVIEGNLGKLRTNST